MVKEITWYEAEDGTQYKTKQQAEAHEKRLKLKTILRSAIPSITDGLHCNINQFFAENIDAICSVADEYRRTK